MSIRKTVRAETDADFAEAQREVRLDFVERTATVEAVVRTMRTHYNF